MNGDIDRGAFFLLTSLAAVLARQARCVGCAGEKTQREARDLYFPIASLNNLSEDDCSSKRRRDKNVLLHPVFSCEHNPCSAVPPEPAHLTKGQFCLATKANPIEIY